MVESIGERFARWRMDQLLVKYDGLRLKSGRHGYTRIAGRLAFVAQPGGLEVIEDEYDIEIVVLDQFPDVVPLVWETAGRIPRTFHKLEGNALCLGSATRLRLTMIGSPSLIGFVERCVIPYLYGHSYFERHRTLPFGELDHGDAGILQDFAALFGVSQEGAAREFVGVASLRRRVANKRPCPCGSGRRLGRCHHCRVNNVRALLGRVWFRRCYARLRSESKKSGRVGEFQTPTERDSQLQGRGMMQVSESSHAA